MVCLFIFYLVRPCSPVNEHTHAYATTTSSGTTNYAHPHQNHPPHLLNYPRVGGQIGIPPIHLQGTVNPSSHVMSSPRINNDSPLYTYSMASPPSSFGGVYSSANFHSSSSHAEHNLSDEASSNCSSTLTGEIVKYCPMLFIVPKRFLLPTKPTTCTPLVPLYSFSIF